MESWGTVYCCSDEKLIQLLKKLRYSDKEIEFIIREDNSGEDRGDSTYRVSYRNVFYPSNFDAGVWGEIYMRDIGNECPLCRGILSSNMPFPKQAFEVDHKMPVVEHFNREGYGMSQLQRREWYNTTDNLRLVHKKCNRQKGGNGYHFAQDKVQIAICNFH